MKLSPGGAFSQVDLKIDPLVSTKTHFTLGEQDAFVIADLPDHVSAAAISLAVTATGAARTKTTALLTPEEVDQAVKKTVKYEPPRA
jgi:uncharacterized protein with GYD domain